MNNEFYLKEMISYIKEDYKIFENIQEEMVLIFKIFHDICKKYNIKYFLAYGSLIGEIRDSGLVPWDSDIDVCIPYNELEVLIEALKKELPSEYFWDCDLNDKYPYFELRIGKVGYNLDYFHFDVFYMIGAPEKEKLKEFRAQIIKLFNIRFEKCQSMKNFSESEENSKIKYYLKKLRSIIRSKFWTMKKINKKFNKLTKMYAYDTATNVCVFDETAYDFKKEIIEPINIRIINGKEIGLPNKVEEYLNRCYKNYKEYPSIEIRYEEYHTWLKNFKLKQGLSKLGTSYYNK